ncbi:MAG TPA: hypothetical protein VGI81_19490 [Tepidisphaeraceae bacterium]|jgi:hypothetical protein
MGPSPHSVTRSIHAIPGSADAGFDRICGNCSYLLIGLPGSGICPECGEPYREDEIVLRGWADGVHQTAATAPPKQLWWSLLGSFAWVVVNLVTDLVAGHWRIATFWFALLACGTAWLLYRRHRLLDDFGGACHLRLSPAGIGQRVGFGPVKLIPWLPGLTVELKPTDSGMYRLTASRPGPGSGYRSGKMLWPIDFEFECSHEQAAMLQDKLDQFRGIERTAQAEIVSSRPSQFRRPERAQA